MLNELTNEIPLKLLPIIGSNYNSLQYLISHCIILML